MTNQLRCKHHVFIRALLLIVVFTANARLSVANFPLIHSETIQKISGVVTDETGAGLPGVSVLRKSTTAGVTTDNNGKFSIDANVGDVLVFSFVGYLKEEVKVANQTVLTITLKPDTRAL